MDGELHMFKDGAAYLAIKAQAPLVPLALLGTREILPMGSSTIRPGRVRLLVGDPIRTTGFTMHDRRRLTETAREQVSGMLNGAISLGTR